MNRFPQLYRHEILRFALAILCVAVVAVSVSLARSLSTDPSYTSSAQLFIGTTGQSSPTEGFSGSQFAASRANSYTQILTGPELASTVISEKHLGVSLSQFEDRVTAAVVPSTVLINVTVSGPTPLEAKDTADALLRAFQNYVGVLESSRNNGQSLIRVIITESPNAPDVATNPRPLRDALVALMLGLVLGALVSIAIVRLDRTIRVFPRSLWTYESQLLGLAPKVKGSHRKSTNDVIELLCNPMRSVELNLRAAVNHSISKSIAVTSANPTEGKTLVALGIAYSLSKSGHSVAIVDANVASPSLGTAFDLEDKPGLLDVLSGKNQLADVLLRVRPGLSVVPTGTSGAVSPATLVESLSRILGELGREFDCVVLDTSSFAECADSAVLAQRCEAAIVVASYGKTSRADLSEAIGLLKAVGANFGGIVIANCPMSVSRATGRRVALKESSNDRVLSGAKQRGLGGAATRGAVDG